MGSDLEATNIIFRITILIILTPINAPPAGSEVAVIPVNKDRIRRLAEQGSRNIALIERLMEDPIVFLSTTQVAITLAGFFSSVPATTGIAQVLAVKMEAWNIFYSQILVGAVVALILAYSNLVFGELVPKRTALQKAQDFSPFYVRLIYYISRIMNPFIRLLSLPTSGFLKSIGVHSENLKTGVSEEEIKSVLETGSETGVFSDIEKEMVTSILSFDDKRAREVMVPRQDMVAIDINGPMEEYIDEVLQSMHFKVPVYEGDIDNIIGVLSTKTLTIETRRKSFDGLNVHSLLMPPCFVPENRRMDTLFREVQKSKTKLAVLIDEYGGMAGVVTLEDLIEEIVGEVHEEYEEMKPEILELELHRTCRISGSISLSGLKKEMYFYMNSSCDTPPGYFMEQLSYIPSQAELPITVVIGEADYETEGMDERVINYVKMTLKEMKKEEETEEEQEQKVQEDMKISFLLDGVMAATWQQLIIYGVGIYLIRLAVKKGYKPSPLLLPGLGVILVNLPCSGVTDQMVQGKVPAAGVVERLLETGTGASEAMPVLLFIGIETMVDFGPLLSQPVLSLFGATAQFGIFIAVLITHMTGFDLKNATPIGIIGAADGPTSILVSQVLGFSYTGPTVVAAYPCMALVPVTQPLAIRLVTTHKERCIHMEYNPKSVSRTLRTTLPTAVTIIVGLVPPQLVAPVGFLMLDNLLREHSMLNSLSQAVQNELINLITPLLGITISFSMQAEKLVNTTTLMVMTLELVAFVFDTIGGMPFIKLTNVFLEMASEKPVNPIIGGCGILTFSMSSRVVQKMVAQEESGNIILVQAAGTNVSGRVASAIAGGFVISIVTQCLQNHWISGDCDKEE